MRPARRMNHLQTSCSVARCVGRWLILLASWVGTGCLPVSAVLFMGTDDPDHNTAPPSGDPNGRGWNYLGEWGSFLGTVIGPRHFVTVRHIGGHVGDRFRFRGNEYPVVAYYDIGKVDLRVWEICEPFQFPEPHASLYRRFDEIGKELVIFGRGTRRGDPVFLEMEGGSKELRGWLHGDADHRIRWGKNVVTLIFDFKDVNPEADVELGEVQILVVDFDRDGGTDEAHLSPGDSGGPLFIQDGPEWLLAGVNYSVEGPFSLTADENEKGFNAAVFDARGFYYVFEEEAGWELVKDRGDNHAIPSAFYSPRLSAYARHLDAVLEGRLEPTQGEPWVLVAPRVDGPYRPVEIQDTLEEFHEIRLEKKKETRFYRLHGCSAYRITEIALDDDHVVLRFEREE